MTDDESSVAQTINDGDSHDIHSLLSSSERDFLVGNNGDQQLEGKEDWAVFLCIMVGSMNSLPQTQTRDRLDDLFKVMGFHHLVLLDENGKVRCDSGVEFIRETEGYPFTTEQIKEQEERAKREQSLKSFLVTQSRDFIVSSDGKKVPVAELEGKTFGLYFSMSSCMPSTEFTPKLGRGESFKQGLGSMPWLALPFKDKSCKRLVRCFELSTLHTLVIIGPDWKTLNSNVAEAIEEHGNEAFPFTPEKFAELAIIEKVREEAQTLESVLVSGDQGFVIGKDEAKIAVFNLVEKNILLYFSAHWCPLCRAFLPKFIEAYHKMGKDQACPGWRFPLVMQGRNP
ncbi:hypothetical protein EZV62_017600 [Acer yangbiense]|uniref:Thioredoxin domain-containing protein n=1 Tax=Acer yangbiense TaxID=1000413 RepID=A0A5C7HGZ2_9ROSI|nr:hypothetical protein EZV62_017600 [Acer yangbiense]